MQNAPRIAYAEDNDFALDDDTAANAYGFEVLSRMKSYAWMKLLLDPAQHDNLHGSLVDKNTSIKFRIGHDVYNREPVRVSLRLRDRRDFSNANLNNEETHFVNGRLMRHVSCEYTVNFAHRSGVLMFSCAYKGQEVGKTTVQFAGQDPQNSSGNSASAGACVPQCAMQ
ncbi:hypothetical protein AC579_9713 [Pseudocercospora musae]|uniref:Uncharacterized protein n=1 Tax=Pseudocercospora musae TaxID=113226 RepID=A0A139I5Z3_9PEZI|nr:hypothetical protein AC579_9713 [Pseudocercospora musae]